MEEGRLRRELGRVLPVWFKSPCVVGWVIGVVYASSNIRSVSHMSNIITARWFPWTGCLIWSCLMKELSVHRCIQAPHVYHWPMGLLYMYEDKLISLRSCGDLSVDSMAFFPTAKVKVPAWIYAHKHEARWLCLTHHRLWKLNTHCWILRSTLLWEGSTCPNNYLQHLIYYEAMIKRASSLM